MRAFLVLLTLLVSGCSGTTVNMTFVSPQIRVDGRPMFGGPVTQQPVIGVAPTVMRQSVIGVAPVIVQTPYNAVPNYTWTQPPQPLYPPGWDGGLRVPPGYNGWPPPRVSGPQPLPPPGNRHRQQPEQPHERWERRPHEEWRER